MTSAEPVKQITLYCLGCGRPVARAEPGQCLAISCVCGALAPILCTEDGQFAPPASLVMARGNTLPHIEYYLGFSDHESPQKSEMIRMLRAFGAISYTECPEARCRESFERSKSRYQEWLIKRRE